MLANITHSHGSKQPLNCQVFFYIYHSTTVQHNKRKCMWRICIDLEEFGETGSGNTRNWFVYFAWLKCWDRCLVRCRKWYSRLKSRSLHNSACRYFMPAGVNGQASTLQLSCWCSVSSVNVTMATHQQKMLGSEDRTIKFCFVDVSIVLPKTHQQFYVLLL